MIVIVLIISAINLALGFFLAVFLENPVIRWTLHTTRKRNGGATEHCEVHSMEQDETDLSPANPCGGETQVEASLPSSDTDRPISLEGIVHDWLTQDPQRSRVVSAALVCLDESCKTSLNLDEEQTTALMEAITMVATNGIRKDRGWDRAALDSEGRLVVLFADAAARNATTCAERIRQTVMAATFTGASEIKATVSCCVSEWQSEESFESLMSRLASGLETTQPAGNCTAVCSSDGVRIARPAKLDVQESHVPLRELATA